MQSSLMPSPITSTQPPYSYNSPQQHSRGTVSLQKIHYKSTVMIMKLLNKGNHEYLIIGGSGMGMAGTSPSHLGITHSLFMSPQHDAPPRSPSHSMVSNILHLQIFQELNGY
jgi:hypothetical protein